MAAQALPGQYLSYEREKRGISVEEVARALRLPVATITGLEQDDFEQLPEAVYIRGYIRAYCQFLGVDAQPVLALREEHGAPGDEPLPGKNPEDAVVNEHVQRLTRIWGTIAVVVAITGLLFLWWRDGQLQRMSQTAPIRDAATQTEAAAIDDAADDAVAQADVAAPQDAAAEGVAAQADVAAPQDAAADDATVQADVAAPQDAAADDAAAQADVAAPQDAAADDATVQADIAATQDATADDAVAQADVAAPQDAAAESVAVAGSPVPSEPNEPNEPSEPSASSEPSEPSEPNEPSEPSAPSASSEPSELNEPSVPSAPSEPSAPSASAPPQASAWGRIADAEKTQAAVVEIPASADALYADMRIVAATRSWTLIRDGALGEVIHRIIPADYERRFADLLLPLYFALGDARGIRLWINDEEYDLSPHVHPLNHTAFFHLEKAPGER